MHNIYYKKINVLNLIKILLNINFEKLENSIIIILLKSLGFVLILVSTFSMFSFFKKNVTFKKFFYIRIFYSLL